MSTIADDLFYHTKLYNKQLKKVLQPLTDYFGVTDSAIHFVNNDALINIHTNEKWMEFCMEKEYYKDDPHITSDELIKTGFTICSYYPSQKYIDGLMKDALQHGMHHSVAYARTTKAGYNAICVSSNINNIDMPNKIINNQKYFLKFMCFLEKELQPILNKLYGHAIDIKSLKNSEHFKENSTKKQKQQQDNINKIKFLKQLGVIDGAISNISLTPREKTCLRCYLIGKTAEDTAKELSLSRKTIENYIENIKIKLNCRYKKNLLEKIDVLDCLGMLD